MTSVDVVIVSYNTREFTLAAVDSVGRQEGVAARVFVADNDSTDGSADAVAEAHPHATVLRTGGNLGFGRANNLAIGAGHAPWILLLNSDAAFREPDALARLLRLAEAQPRLGALGPRMVGADDSVQHSVGGTLTIRRELLRGLSLHPFLGAGARARVLGSEFFDYGREGEAAWLVGACLLLRREAFAAVGGFDPAIFMYGEEVELAMRLREAGWSLRYTPEVTVLHHRGASSPKEWQRSAAMAGDAYIVRKHRGFVGFSGFSLSRVLRFCTQALLQGTVGLLAASPARRARAADSLADLRAWIRAIRGGASRNPSAPAFLPPGASPPPPAAPTGAEGPRSP